MKVNLDLSLQKQVTFFPMTVAKIEGDVELKVIAEVFTRGRVKQELVEALRDSDLDGQIEIDGEQVDIG